MSHIIITGNATVMNFSIEQRIILMAKNEEKGQQHPKDFPGGHPPQYYPGLARLNFGVRMGSGAFNAVWPLTNSKFPKPVEWRKI
jgi:hypothetical protein